MSYVSPPEVTEEMLDQGTTKARLSSWQQVLRSTIAVFVLGCATALALAVIEETDLNLAGALIFPLGLSVVVVLGLELLTGNFALLPLAVMEGRAKFSALLRNFSWVLLGHVLGALLCAVMFTAWTSEFFTRESGLLITGLVDTAVEKTLQYQELGVVAGISLALLSGILCNWLVVLGVVMGMTSSSTTGKIVALWIPIAAFFYLELEHAVVNLFVIPAGMMLGADVSIADWMIWNQIPVLVGNLIGGLLMALPLYFAYRHQQSTAEEKAE